MNRNRHPIGTSLLFVAVTMFAIVSGFSQEVSSLPPWLESYPGATATVRSSDTLIESSYTTSAQTKDVVTHYSALFKTAGLPFEPNADGVGASIRTTAAECDLLIQIRDHPEGTFVKVNCSAKTKS